MSAFEEVKVNSRVNSIRNQAIVEQIDQESGSSVTYDNIGINRDEK